MLSESLVASVTKTAAVVLGVLDAIGSFVLGHAYPVIEGSRYSMETHQNWPLTFAVLITTAIFALILYGFGEVIELLHYSLKEQRKISAALEKQEAERTDQKIDA